MKQIVVNHPDVLPWIAHQTRSEFSSIGVTLGLVSGLEIVAGVLYDNYNGANIHATIAGTEGKNWLTREFIRVMFDYPFRQLKVKRITVVIADDNARSIALAEHLGFSREATLVDAYPTGNLLIYVMHRASCRWLPKEV